MGIKIYMSIVKYIDFHTMSKKILRAVRISDIDKKLMDRCNIGITAVARVGLDTLRLYIQGCDAHSCVYISKTGRHAAPPADGSQVPGDSPAHVCPCPSCPIKAAFTGRAAPKNKL